MLEPQTLNYFKIIAKIIKKIKNHSFHVELWPQFHTFRVREVPCIWKCAQQAVPDIDSILAQKVMEYALVIPKEVSIWRQPVQADWAVVEKERNYFTGRGDFHQICCRLC